MACLMPDETATQRADRILSMLRSSYPGKRRYDVDGRGMHFVCEVEPVADDSGYDRAVEVIISSTRICTYGRRSATRC